MPVYLRTVALILPGPYILAEQDSGIDADLDQIGDDWFDVPHVDDIDPDLSKTCGRGTENGSVIRSSRQAASS